MDSTPVSEAPKRKRGRPRKSVVAVVAEAGLAPEPRKRGRPTKGNEQWRKWHGADTARALLHLSLLGASMERAGMVLGVSRDTLEGWLEKYPEARIAWDRGNSMAAAEVANALLQRALGMTVTTTRQSTKDTPDGVEMLNETVTTQLPPDTRACVEFLQRKEPRLWGMVKDMEARDTPDGGVSLQITFEAVESDKTDYIGELAAERRAALEVEAVPCSGR